MEIWSLRILWTVSRGESDEHVFNIFPRNLNFDNFPEKPICRIIDRNLTVGPIELIETAIEMSTPSLSSETINKIKIFTKIFIKNRGGTLNKSYALWKYEEMRQVYTANLNETKELVVL